MDPDTAENAHLETSLRSWVSSLLPAHAASLGDENISLHDVLKSGVILCEIMNIIKPGSMKRISTISTAYKQLENVQNYLNMCKIMGMQASQLFESSDLVNGKFKSSILINLKTLQGIHDRFSKSTSTMVSSSSSSSLAASTSTPNSTISKPISSTAPVATSATPAHSSTSSPSTSGIVRKNSVISTSSLSSETASAAKPKSVPDDVIRSVVNTKPDDKIVGLVQRWIEVLLTSRTPAGKTLFEWLKNGVVLLRVLNAVKPDICKVIYEGNIGFKQIENVQRYLKLCPIAVGSAVPLFSVADLTDESDLIAVTSHLHAMISLVQRESKWNGPTLDSIHHDMKLESSSASISPRTSSTSSETTSTSSTSVQLSTHSSISSETKSEPQTDSNSQSLQDSAPPSASTPQTSPLSPQHDEVPITLVKSETQLHSSPQSAIEFSSAIPSNTAPVQPSPAVDSPEIHTKEESPGSLANKGALATTPKESTLPPLEASILPSDGTPKVEYISEVDRVRKEFEAERLAMQEERRIFAEQMQAETERKLREMVLNLEEKTAAVIAKERRRSVAMSALLEEERREKEKIASQLEEERKSRLVILEENDRRKDALTIQAQIQMQAVADRLQEETTKRLEVMASKITSEAMEKADIELRKKDEHLMKQLDRERVLRSRLDVLEEEKKSLSRTFERKFAALETELQAAKSSTKSASPATPAPSAVIPTITTTLVAGSEASSSPSPSTVDASTIKEFKEWNTKWRSNRMMTKQLTRNLTELSSSCGPSAPDSPNSGATNGLTPRANISAERTGSSEVGLDAVGEDSEDLHLSLVTPRSELDLGSDVDEPMNLDLDRKQWLDDDWSEEEDWESEDDEDFEESDEDDEDERSGDDEKDAKTRGRETQGSHTPAKLQNGKESGATKKSPISPSKDEWSQFSGMNLSRFS